MKSAKQHQSRCRLTAAHKFDKEKLPERYSRDTNTKRKIYICIIKKFHVLSSGYYDKTHRALLFSTITVISYYVRLSYSKNHIPYVTYRYPDNPIQKRSRLRIAVTRRFERKGIHAAMSIRLLSVLKMIKMGDRNILENPGDVQAPGIRKCTILGSRGQI